MPVIAVDWTISVGNLLTIVIIGLGAMSAFYRLQGDLRVLRHEFRNMEAVQLNLQENLTSLTTIMTQIAVQQTRLDMLQTDIEDMKHGRGFVLDLPVGRGPK